MIDLRAARNDPEDFRRRLTRKGAAEAFDELLEADRAVLVVQPQVEELRARRKLKGKPTPEQLAELETVKADLQQLENELAGLEARRQELLARIPNPPDDETPDGFTDEDAVVIRRVGEPPSFDFPARDHLDLAQVFGWIDMERAAKVSGARFAYRVGEVALLELALYRYALDRLVAKGFIPVLPPVLVREDAMYGTGFLPTEEMNIYKVERDDLYLTGTAEVGLAAMHMGEILDADSLPLRYAGYSTNFRREAGAAGKDTRGMFRVHQFDKVEMFVFITAEHARDEHERLLAIEEELIGDLDIPYRVVNIAAGDLGASAAKKYDVEGWFPGQERYRELTSTSNTTDYQARRLDVRTRRDGKLEHVFTLNGTAITARTMIALMENFQDADGGISVPERLRDFGAPRKLAEFVRGESARGDARGRQIAAQPLGVAQRGGHPLVAEDGRKVADRVDPAGRRFPSQYDGDAALQVFAAPAQRARRVRRRRRIETCSQAIEQVERELPPRREHHVERRVGIHREASIDGPQRRDADGVSLADAMRSAGRMSMAAFSLAAALGMPYTALLA